MKLSIVVVNYNVKYFLDQCLYAVERAIEGMDAEVFIVDNQSKDGSVEMLHEKYNHFHIIANTDNVGFSKANNQAIRQAKGEYVLLLNPDTIIEEDTLKKCVEFMDDHTDCGGLGIKMVDGAGNFLPESKRGLPTPSVSFYKIFGLSKLFPHSKKFSKYHMGHLDKEENHEVEILAGAFMMMRKSVLDEIGLLDETFFMYGEDIDLSYRIIKAGYKNYYFSESQIIHYKGESTKKGSINYVFVFYNAMVIFAKKHFSQKNARLFSFFINLAIYFRAFLAIVSRFWKKAFLPVLDTILLSGGIIVIKNLWEHSIFPNFENYFPDELVYTMLPTYIFVWLFSVFLSGGYDKPILPLKIIRGFLAGTVFILAAYGLLSESYRFSRAVILLGAFWAMFSTIALRYFLRLIKPSTFQIGENTYNRFLVITHPSESKSVIDLVKNTQQNPEFIGLVSIDKEDQEHEGYVGSFHQLEELIDIFKINQIVFSLQHIELKKMIETITQLKDKNIHFRTTLPNRDAIIGSNSIQVSGNHLISRTNPITKKSNRRNKRVFDLLSAFILLITYPLHFFLVKQKLNFLSNIISVLFGKKTWIGYFQKSSDTPFSSKKHVITATGIHKNIDEKTMQQLNEIQIHNYHVYSELTILLKRFKELGN